MALLAWYPLDGTLEDYSGNRTEMTGTWTIDTNGKIGKCYKKNGTMTMPISPKEIGSIYTFMFWIYTPSEGTTANLFGIDSVADTRSSFSFFQYPTRNDFHWSLNTLAGYDTGVLTNGAWTHVCIVCEQNQISRYYNGVLKGTSKGTINFDDSRDIGIKGISETKLNDIRIYNEALSLKEIKEISKAKILHYNFNQFAESTTNMNKNFSFSTSEKYSDYCVKTSADNWYTGISLSRTNVVGGKTYTWSIEVKGNRDFTANFDPNCTATNYTGNDAPIETSKPSSTGVAVKANQWTKVYLTVKIRDDAESPYLHHSFCPRVEVGEENLEIYARNSQVEEKDHYTKYTNGTRTDRVTDSSGFRNHSASLNLIETPQWYKDGVLGGGCYKFENAVKTSTGNYQHFKSKETIRIPEQGTISFYIKHEGTTNSDNKYAVGFSHFCSMNNNGIMGLIYYYEAGNYASRNVSCNFYDGNWHLYTITWDAENKLIKLYKDGEKQYDGSSNTLYHAGTYRYFLVGNAWGTSYGGHSGYIDDVRVYATALSDDDIKELYQLRGSVSKNAKLIINEVVEIENLFNPNLILARQEELGINKNSRMIEKDGATCLALSASSFYKSTVYYSIFPDGYFKENTSYKFDLMVNGNLIHNGSEVPFGFVIYYTDGTSYNFSHKTSGTWKRVTYTTPTDKTIDKVGVYYYIGDLFYCDINNCYITEVINPSVNKNGQLISKEIVESNYKPSLIDYSSWTVGDTVPSGWSNNGSATENCRLIYPNPRGNMDIMWATLSNDAESNSDGGFHSPIVNIDKTKKHRFSVWIKRENIGDGRTYLGLNAYDSSSTENGLLRLDGTAITNPYFTNFVKSNTFGSACDNDWILIVGYIHPEDYSGSNDSTNGAYKKDGTRLGGLTDYKWSSTASKARIRSYLYYSTSTEERQYFYRPRIDVCDGSEPSIQELLTCNEHVPLVDMSGVYKPIDIFSISKKGNVFGKEFIEF